MSILHFVYNYRTFWLNRQDSIKNAKNIPYNIRITIEYCSVNSLGEELAKK
jgi:hypothetical protein